MPRNHSKRRSHGKGAAGTGVLRITSGALRGRLVAAPPGEGTRPLLTRVRKSLADLLRPRLAGAAVLDLFAGSGAIGFELLSNGAAHCTMVERAAGVAALIRRSAEQLGVTVEVHHADALAFLERRPCPGPFDVVVVAPPYGLGLQQRAVDGIEAAELLAPGGLVVVQRDAAEPPWQSGGGVLACARVRRYGRTVFEFLVPAPDLENS